MASASNRSNTSSILHAKSPSFGNKDFTARSITGRDSASSSTLSICSCKFRNISSFPLTPETALYCSSRRFTNLSTAKRTAVPVTAASMDTAGILHKLFFVVVPRSSAPMWRGRTVLAPETLCTGTRMALRCAAPFGRSWAWRRSGRPIDGSSRHHAASPFSLYVQYRDVNGVGVPIDNGEEGRPGLVAEASTRKEHKHDVVTAGCCLEHFVADTSTPKRSSQPRKQQTDTNKNTLGEGHAVSLLCSPPKAK
ncbi:hypothetical protein B296_00012544 [Ensete ventricosum]|uniref:Uncharacterized protein n=1 Tax=Ensete ventricosum TaxID=4639 RepID=A0A426Z7S3_ENSVE|nr:hypothetical protein B296_00012544 [Ensete ventricosum]